VKAQRHTQGDRVRKRTIWKTGLEGALKRKKIGPEDTLSE